MFRRIMLVLYAAILWLGMTVFTVSTVPYEQGRTPNAGDWAFSVGVGLLPAAMLFIISLVILVLIRPCWSWIRTGEFW